MHTNSLVSVVLLSAVLELLTPLAAQGPGSLSIQWDKNYLTIRGAKLPGEVSVHYLEAYCRPGSTDRDWAQTVIGHTTELISSSPDGREIRLRDTLKDGVVVDHTLTATTDEVDIRITAHNPTDRVSLAHWAQPCVRVDKFTGTTRDDARTLVPRYARQCFLFVDGKLTMLPTEPWADLARYVPGQVYCPQHVDRDDVNPRPLSQLVPSNGLTGCFSADRKQMMAVAFEPYQEIFQGVIACMHNDFRLGGLQPGETKHIRGKFYFVDADAEKLLARFNKDFPEQAQFQSQK